MSLKLKSTALWLRPENLEDGFKITSARVTKIEDQKKGSYEWQVVSLSTPEQDYLVSTFAIDQVKGSKEIDVGDQITLFMKPGNKSRFFIKNIEEDIR